MNPIPPVMSVVMLVLHVQRLGLLWLHMARCDTWEAKPHGEVCVDYIGPIISSPGEPVQRSPPPRRGALAAAPGPGSPGMQEKGAERLLPQAARHLHRNSLQSAQLLLAAGGRKNVLTQEVNVMRGAQDTEITKLRIGKDGTLRIPAHVVSTAQLQTGDEVTVRVKPKQLAVVGSMMTEELLAQFVRDTQRWLAHVDESYRMADWLTLDAYLALSDAERDVLWHQARQEAHNASEREPERYIPAHYIPAGQKHRARCVRGKS